MSLDDKLPDKPKKIDYDSSNCKPRLKVGKEDNFLLYCNEPLEKVLNCKNYFRVNNKYCCKKPPKEKNSEKS